MSKNVKVLNLKYAGVDDFYRPVFKDQNGDCWKDCEPKRKEFLESIFSDKEDTNKYINHELFISTNGLCGEPFMNISECNCYCNLITKDLIEIFKNLKLKDVNRTLIENRDKILSTFSNNTDTDEFYSLIVSDGKIELKGPFHITSVNKENDVVLALINASNSVNYDAIIDSVLYYLGREEQEENEKLSQDNIKEKLLKKYPDLYKREEEAQCELEVEFLIDRILKDIDLSQKFINK